MFEVWYFSGKSIGTPTHDSSSVIKFEALDFCTVCIKIISLNTFNRAYIWDSPYNTSFRFYRHNPNIYSPK